MPWHCVEHLVCVHWTRPERAYCSRAPEPTRWPPRLWPALQNLATYSPSHHYAPSRSSPRPASQELAAAAPRQPCALQRRPSHPGSPPAPVSSACSSAASSPSARRRHDALQLQKSGRRRSYPWPPREPASSAYLKGPQARSRLQATSDSPRRASQAVDRPVVAIFLNSGQCGRRQAPV